MRWGKLVPLFSYLHEGFLLCFQYISCLQKNSRTIRYLVTTIWVFEYYLEITNGPNTNSTIRSQLFKYQIIRIIWSNSETYECIFSFLDPTSHRCFCLLFCFMSRNKITWKYFLSTYSYIVEQALNHFAFKKIIKYKPVIFTTFVKWIFASKLNVWFDTFFKTVKIGTKMKHYYLY